MLDYLSKKISSFFISRGDINEADRETYDYCFEIMLSTLLNTIFLIVCGIISGCFLPTILFMIGFILFRTASGGFHAGTHLRCFMTLVVVYGLLLVSLFFLPNKILILSAVIMLLAGTPFIYFLAPIEHPNNPLDPETSAKLSRRAKFCAVTYPIFIMLLLFFKAKPEYIFSLCYGMFSVSMSLAAVKIQGKIERGDN